MSQAALQAHAAPFGSAARGRAGASDGRGAGLRSESDGESPQRPGRKEAESRRRIPSPIGRCSRSETPEGRRAHGQGVTPALALISGVLGARDTKEKEGAGETGGTTKARGRPRALFPGKDLDSSSGS